MEVLGAVASSIAVLQALAAGKHVVNLIREVPDIQNDFDNLMEELGLIRSMTEEVSGMPSTPLVQGLIKSAADDLNRILGELDTLLRNCARETDQEDKKLWKTKKRKWLFEGSNIRKLQQRMTNAKINLHLAITSSQTSNNTQFQAEMRQMFMSFYMVHMETRSVIEGSRTKELIANQVSSQLQNDIGAATSAVTISSEADNTSPTNALVRVQSRPLVRQTPYLASCPCRCHFSENTHQTSGWMQSLLGSLLVRYNSLPRKECSDPTCRCTSSTALKMEYQVPRWLLSRAFGFSASYGSLTGLNCSIRPVNLLDVSSDLWEYQEGSMQMIRRSVIRYNVYPNDMDANGGGLLEYALNQQLYPAVEVLLDLWKNLLPEVGLSRNVAYEAEYMIRNFDLSDHETYLVQKALSFVKDRPERTMTKVHIALCQGTDLHEALQEQPWAVDMIDDTSFTPLHLATRNGQLKEVGILIDSGADVDQQTHDGWTALMLAVDRESVEIVKLLIKAKCSVNMADSDQRPALHVAARSNNPELVGLLLTAGASLTQREDRGNTPLHHLAWYSTASLDNMRTIIETLVMAGADLDARNDKGRTALIQAVIYNNITAVRALVEAGASLSASDHYSENFLHFAARDASLEALESLCDMCLYGINTYQRSSWGDTPWDDLIVITNSDEWNIGATARYPNPAEQEAFVRLYQDIRDRNLQHDIDSLEQTLSALREQHSGTARENLAPLLRKESGWKRDNLVSWYRAVDKRIEHSEWALAIEDVEEYIVDLREELGTQVWETPSRYGYLWDSDAESLVSDEESSDSYEVISDDDDLQQHRDVSSNDSGHE